MNSLSFLSESRKLVERVVAFSLSYEKENGRARGLGAEHLRETLLHIARPLLRGQAAIAYGGKLDPVEPPEVNFTLELLKLIREEQQERSTGSTTVRGLYNFQAWPFYLSLDRAKEAEWINCCQTIRITQQMAGLTDPLPNNPAESDPIGRFLHGAVCLSAMRNCMAEGCNQLIAGTPAQPQPVPPIWARIVLGGKTSGFSGIMPGIFEEVLTARENGRMQPVFILGGFGGAAGTLAEVLINGAAANNPRLTPEYYAEASENPQKPGYADLLKNWDTGRLPAGMRSPWQGMSALRALLENACLDRAAFLQNGLTDQENLRLLTTVDPTEAVRLVVRGLAAVM